MTRRPNVLLITADQWRGDCLGIAGHPQVRTQNVDALAAQGTYFARHYAATAPCSPARASLYTGLYQMNHRVLANGSPLDDRFDNVARAARRAGYLPTLFGYTDTSPDPRSLHPNDPALTSYEGILPGFMPGQLLLEDDKTWLAWLKAKGYAPEDLADIHKVAEEKGERISRAPTRYGADETPTAFLTDAFLSWLDQQDADRPWFAHVSYLRPHPPICVPEPFNRLYDETDGPTFAGSGTAEQEAEVHPLMAALLASQKLSSHIPGAAGRPADLDPRDFARLRALYYGMISEVDAQIGRLIAGLGVRDQDEDTLIILTSDHAEMMGDHLLLGKGGYHEESYHVPLIIRAPSGQRKTSGEIVTRFTSAVDIFPTLADVLGVVPTHEPDGRSLLPFLEGKIPDGWREAALWEYSFRSLDGAGLGTDVGKTLLSLRSDTWQYVHFPQAPDLFLSAEDRKRPRLVPMDSVPVHQHISCLETLLATRLTHHEETLSKHMVWAFHPDR